MEKLRSLAIITCLAGCAGVSNHPEKPVRVPNVISQPKAAPKPEPKPEPVPGVIADYQKDFEDAVYTAFNDHTATIERAYLAIDELEHRGDIHAEDAESSTGDQKIDMLRKAASHYLSALKAIEMRLRLIFNISRRFPGIMGSNRLSGDEATAFKRKTAAIIAKLQKVAAEESNAIIDQAQRIENSIGAILNRYAYPRH